MYAERGNPLSGGASSSYGDGISAGLARPEGLETASEGHVHCCQGVLSRKTTKARMTKWKKRWFTVAPGEYRIVFT